MSRFSLSINCANGPLRRALNAYRWWGIPQGAREPYPSTEQALSGRPRCSISSGSLPRPRGVAPMQPARTEAFQRDRARLWCPLRGAAGADAPNFYTPKRTVRLT